ncbi:hypothetical protein BJV82DRAFT_591666 [Fennellomyces sp. T-0311]|nr:hypothetical protein BJV82DRAFT_591666 [Fennellomyces sp. T-0311]
MDQTQLFVTTTVSRYLISFPPYYPMRNETPCKNCRIRRRKCVWKPNATICERCAKIHLECVPIDDLSDDEAENEYNYARLQYWWNQVAELEGEMEKLGEAIRQSLPTRALPLTADVMDINGDAMSTTSSDSGSSSTSSSSSDDKEWTLSVVDGHLRLETGISNVQELFRYSQASLRYLSPFIGLFQKERVYFDTTAASIALAPFGFISRTVAGKPRKRLAITHEPLTINYLATIEQLVMQYIQYNNPNIGLIHVPTFLKHYRSLKDPMACPLTMAICVDATVSPRVNAGLSPAERRTLAEIFFRKCKEMMFDMPDDPDQKLQFAMSITFLQQYLTDGIIQYDESRRMSTIAYLICKDIEPIYSDRSRAPLVARIMFQRHYIFHEAMIRMCNMILEDKVDYKLPQIELEVAPDELPVTRKHITVYNHLLRLAASPFATLVMEQINCNIHGVPGQLSLDLILQYEPVVREWWAGLPDDIRPCEDPFSRDTLGVIENIVEPTHNLVLTFVHTLTVIFYACMLKPRHMHSDTATTEEMLEIIRQKALDTAVLSSEIVIFALRRNLDLVTDSLPRKLHLCLPCVGGK